MNHKNPGKMCYAVCGEKSARNLVVKEGSFFE